MKKSLIALALSSLFLLSACDDQSNKIKQLEAKIVELEAVVPALKDEGEIFFYEKGNYTSLRTIPKTQIAWVNDLVLVELFRREEGVIPRTDDPHFRENLKLQLKREFDESNALNAEMIAEMKAEIGNEEGWEVPITMTSWFYYSNTRLASQNYNVASFYTNSESYSGGAHGMHGFGTLHIDLKKREVIRFDDFIAKEHHEELKALLWDVYLQHEVNSELNEVDEKLSWEAQQKERDKLAAKRAQITETYWAKKAEMPIATYSFDFDESGVTFTYSPYELGPYAVGSVILSLPWEKVEHLVNPAYRPAKPLISTEELDENFAL